MKTIIKNYVGSYGIIINNNKIILIKKAGGGYKGKLDLPGGGIEHTELPTEALVRELDEEVGIIVDDYSLLDVTSVNIKWEMKRDLWEDLHHIGILYFVTTSCDKVKTEADGRDSAGARWYNIDELDKDNLSPFARYALEKLKLI